MAPKATNQPFLALSCFELRHEYRLPGGRRLEALRNATLQVRAGEIYGLLGPNGAGKTTTLRIALDLLRPTAGRTLIFGQPPAAAQTRRKVGFVPEQALAPAHLTPPSILHRVGALRGIPQERREDWSLSTLRRVGLEHAQDQRFRQLSRGQRQRLGLAAALMGKPSLLILDEPTAGFDPLARAWFKDFLRELQEDGATIVLSSHLLNEVQEVCDRVGIIHAGRVLAEDTVERVLARRQSRTLEDAFVSIIKEHSGGEDLERGFGHSV